MLILLSPAKSLDYETPPTTDKHTLPQFVDESAALIDRALVLNSNLAEAWFHGGWVKNFLGEPDRKSVV